MHWLMNDPVKQAVVEGKDPVRDWVIDFFGKNMGGWIVEKCTLLITTLNEHSPEIIVICAIVCAFGVMIAPMTTGNASKWIGRLAATLLGGVIWRLLI
jgi:hypothetical protein